jgi:Phage tail protein
MTGAVSFDSNNIQTYTPVTDVGIIVNDILIADLPDKIANLYALANANRSVIPNVDYPSRKIGLSGSIKGSSQSDLDSRVDVFKGYFNGKDKNLDIEVGGATRRFIATVNAISIVRRGSHDFATFTVELICSEPFGRDIVDTTALSALARTGSSYADAYSFLGTAPFQLPLVTILINTVTGGDAYLSFGNANNGQSVNITGVTFADGDEIEIDSVNKTVKVNGQPVDYTGAIPEFEPGDTTFNYADGFTTRNFHIIITYKKMYL